MDSIESGFLEFQSSIAGRMGVDNVMSTILALLYLEPDPIPMEQIAEKSGYSLASISNKAKMMQSMGLLKRTTQPGSRKLYLYMEKDISKILREQLLQSQEVMIETAKKELPVLIAAAEERADQEQKIQLLKRYLQEMLRYERFIQEMLKTLDKMDQEEM
ncbi:MAG: GbsR/MarR family transcriptional regulator [Nanoarchaeota archaeon]